MKEKFTIRLLLASSMLAQNDVTAKIKVR